MKVKNGWAERRPFSWYANFDDNFGWLMPITMVGGFFSEFGIGMTTDALTDGSGPVAISMTVWPLIIAFFGFGHFLSEISWVNNHEGTVYLHSQRSLYGRSSLGSRDLLRQVMALSKDDQRLFPNNLVETLRRDLHPSERKKINQAIVDTLSEIDKRNATRREAEQKAIYTDGVMAVLEDARKSVRSEHDILKEYL